MLSKTWQDIANKEEEVVSGHCTCTARWVSYLAG